MAMQLNLSRIKQEAKALKKQSPLLKHTQALEQVVKAHGFKSYEDYISTIKDSDYRPLIDFDVLEEANPIDHLSEQNNPSDIKSTQSTISSEISLAYKTRDEVHSEFRELAAKFGVDFALLIPTETGLKKAILDATAPIRNLFESSSFHYYQVQGKGTGSKVLKQAVYVTAANLVNTTVSLYRPETKNGDPRMWFSRLKEFAQPNDRIAIVFHESLPHLINLTALPDVSAISSFLSLVSKQGNKDALELIGKLKLIAQKGPIKAISQGDTAVGMAVERALGIGPNSAKGPDYLNRIELKAAREGKFGKARQTRQTLFAQVADWGHPDTNFKSSSAILSRFGYDRGVDFKLYCTISASRVNSQGLSFFVSENDEAVYEIHDKEGVVAVWPAKLLMNRLLQKHSETFWIKAQSSKENNGDEQFILKSVIHTKKPLENQLMQLIREGHVTMDHLIKRTQEGQVKEKGPLFKISPYGFKLLFPDPIEYPLN